MRPEPIALTAIPLVVDHHHARQTIRWQLITIGHHEHVRFAREQQGHRIRPPIVFRIGLDVGADQPALLLAVQRALGRHPIGQYTRYIDHSS